MRLRGHGANLWNKKHPAPCGLESERGAVSQSATAGVAQGGSVAGGGWETLSCRGVGCLPVARWIGPEAASNADAAAVVGTSGTRHRASQPSIQKARSSRGG